MLSIFPDFAKERKHRLFFWSKLKCRIWQALTLFFAITWKPYLNIHMCCKKLRKLALCPEKENIEKSSRWKCIKSSHVWIAGEWNFWQSLRSYSRANGQILSRSNDSSYPWIIYQLTNIYFCRNILPNMLGTSRTNVRCVRNSLTTRRIWGGICVFTPGRNRSHVRSAAKDSFGRIEWSSTRTPIKRSSPSWWHDKRLHLDHLLPHLHPTITMVMVPTTTTTIMVMTTWKCLGDNITHLEVLESHHLKIPAWPGWWWCAIVGPPSLVLVKTSVRSTPVQSPKRETDNVIIPPAQKVEGLGGGKGSGCSLCCDQSYSQKTYIFTY